MPLPGAGALRVGNDAEGQMSASAQSAHRGRLAMQTRLPWSISVRPNDPQSRGGSRAQTSDSIRTGSLDWVKPSSFVSRATWVSTARPGRSNATLLITLAVFRPTPGRLTRSSIAVGTSPANLLSSSRPRPMRLRALARKNPVWWMISSSSPVSAQARSAGVGYRANSAGVTEFTRISVVCADSTVAARSWNGLSNASSHRSVTLPG